MSGSLTQEGQVIAPSLAAGNSYEFSVGSDGVVDSTANISSSADLYGASIYLGGVQVSATAAELNALDGIADAAYDASADSVVFFDATDSKLKYEAADDFVAAIAGDGLINNSGVLDFDVANLGTSLTGDLDDADLIAVEDNSGGGTKKAAFSVVRDAVFNDVSGDATIAAGGALTIANNAVSGSNISDGGVANSKLVNSSVTIGSTAVSLGDTQTSFSGLTGLDFTAASAAIASSIGANNLTLGGSTSTVIIAGNLTVQGTTTTVDSTTINISSSFTFEGIADDYETTLGIVDPSADRTIYLPNTDGVLAILDPSLSDSELATAITAAPAELNLLDAGAGSSVALASGDGLIIFDASDSDNGKKVLMSDVSTYVGSNIAVNVQNVAAAGTLQVGVNYFSDMGSDGEDAVTLPASPSVGQSVKVKAPSDCSAARYITINRAGSQTIDGETSIRLESPFAAVELVYVASNLWRVF